MLYEYNGKIYVKPFSNKLVEVEVSFKNGEYDVKATKRVVEITPEIKKKVFEVSLEQAYKKQNKNKMETI